MSVGGTPHTLGRSAKQRAWLVLGMITVAALGNIRLPIRAFAEFVRKGGDREMELNLARFQRLEPYLPARGHVGYLSDATVSEGRRRDGVYQAMHAQYALAPHLVERF